MQAYVNLASNIGDTFSNALAGDLMFYTMSNTQQILFGSSNAATAAFTINSNLMTLAGNLQMNGGFNARGMKVLRPNGLITNVTTSSVQGHSNDTTGIVLSVASNTSNYSVRVQGNTTQVASISGIGNMVLAGNIAAGNVGMFRNRIINGDMRINQRGITSSNMTNVNGYVTDRFCLVSGSITGGTITSSNVPLTSNDTPYAYGINNSMRVTSSAALTIGGALYQCQTIEGTNISDFCWGSSYGTAVSLSFWLRTSMSNNSQLSVAFRNVGANSTFTSYVTNVTTTGSNIWQYVSMTIPAPASGTTWNSGSTSGGLEVFLGSYYNPQTSSGWFAGVNSFNTTASSPWYNGANGFIEFTGVQLEKGTIATPFEFRPYAIELQLCQRYYYRMTTTNNSSIFLAFYGGTSCYGLLNIPVAMRNINTTTLNVSGTITGLTGNMTLSISPVGGGSSTQLALQGSTASSPSVANTASWVYFNSANAYLEFINEL